MILYMTLQEGTNTYVHLHQPKKWLQEAKAQGSKIKSKGLDLFWLNTCGWSSKVGPTGKKSHHQANHPLIGHDGTNSRILCQRAPKLQNICFLLKIQLSLQKGTDTHVQLHQPKKWLEEAEAQVSKIKSKGLDLFLTEYLRIIFKGWPHKKNVASPGQLSTDRTWWDEFKNFVSTRAQITKHMFFAENAFVLAKGYRHTCSALPTKKRWLEEAEAQVSKIKSKGLDLFLAEFLWMIFKGWPHRKKIASPGQPSIDRKWWDKWKNFVPTCGQIAKQAFFPEDTFVHAKGLRISVGICRTALVKPWTLKNCELSAGKSGARNSFFSVSDWGGGRYGMLPTQASRK